MKQILLIKLLTLASFFVFGVRAEAQSCDNPLSINARTSCETAFKGNDEKIKTCAATLNCLQAKKEDEDRAKQDKKDEAADKEKSVVKCETALSKYDTSMKDTSAECERLNVKNSLDCRKKAKECSSGLSGGIENDDPESSTQSLVNLINVYGKMQNGGGKDPALDSCVTDDVDAAKREDERIDDKITRLREEAEDIKEKAIAVDKELAEKKQDVEKEMLDVEKDAEKAKFDKQTKNQEDAGRMQKAIMNSEKKRRDNILKIADLNVDIANFTFAHQKLNLALSDDRITKECRDKSIAAMNLKMKGSYDPKSGKEAKPKFTQKESMQFKKDLKQEESSCLQEKALQRVETTKALVDAKRKVKIQADTLSASNVDEEKAIASEIKQMEAMKAISADEEKKAIEGKVKKLNALNKSVTDMDKYVTDKKKSYDEKSKAKNDLIAKLQLDRQNVKPKFKKVSSAVDASGRAAAVYLNMCCNFKVKDENHADCSRVEEDEPEGKTSKTKIAKPAKIK